MKYSLSTLPNRFRVLVVSMPQLESATVTIWVKTGSRMEEARVSGISHFLEHMVFKGSKKRPSAKEIFGAVDAIGGDFNAATSKDWTNFYIKVRSSNLEEAFDVLSDMILNPLLLTEELEREKGVIVEELRMHEDTPMIHIGDVFEQLIFQGNSLGRDIIGTEKTIRSVKRDDFVRYRSIYYHTRNMLLTIAGGVKEHDVTNLTNKYFRDLNSLGRTVKGKNFRSSQKKPMVKLHSKKKEQGHFILGYLGNGRTYEGKYIDSVLAGGGASSRLFIEVRERRGLAYAVKTSFERYLETGYIGTQAGVDVKRIDEAIKVTLGEHYKLANGKSPISAKELKKAKEFIKGNVALSLEDTRDVDSFFGEQALFLEEVLTPEEVFKKIDAVSVEDVVRAAKKLFRQDRLNLAIIGPYESQERFEKLIK